MSIESSISDVLSSISSCFPPLGGKNIAGEVSSRSWIFKKVRQCGPSMASSLLSGLMVDHKQHTIVKKAFFLD